MPERGNGGSGKGGVFYDAVIVGSGLAGLSTALAAAEAGLSVCVLSKEDRIEETNTLYAQGGIVADGEGDSAALREKDIFVAGDQYNFTEAVRLVAEEGPGLVREYLIDKAGVPFLRDAKGELDRTQEAAHSVRRIIHVKDETGKAIETAMLEYCRRNPRIEFRASRLCIDLISSSHHSSDPQYKYRPTRVCGVYAFDAATGNVETILARAVVLATGGAGNLFLHTSNPRGATGDGLAMAQRVGAEINNCEFVQFHPTILFHRDVKRFLISESVRGEGARLVNKRGEYFMEQYSPDLKDLAPRDEVARAIYYEMDASEAEYVFLDATRMRDVDPADRFPRIYRQCLDAGIDMRKDPIPVVPAAHYFCGGVKTDLDGRTSVSGLFAAGEAACTGLHGANRLASVSLLEALVFGVRVGRLIAAGVPDLPRGLAATIPDWVYPRSEEDFDTVLMKRDMTTIQSTMWNYAGIIRTSKRLLRAQADLEYYSHRIERFYKTARLNRDIIELRHSVLSSTLIVRSALSNTESRGCHFIE